MTVASPDVAFGVLGEVRAVAGGEEVRGLGGPQSRTLLAALVVAGGRVVGVAQLVDALWAGEPPSSAVGSLQAYVSRLRRALGAAGPVLERRGPGYRLAAPATAFDWWCFEDLAERGRAALVAGDAAAARDLLVRAESLWRGEPLAGLAERPFAAGVVARLHERRVTATGDRHEAELRLGRHVAVLGELAEAVQERPLDEARWARLALARYRSGQQAEALRTLADARRRLLDELGVEPGPALRRLELQVLRQDPALDGLLQQGAAGQQVLPTWGARLRMQLGVVEVLEGRVDDGVALFEEGHAVCAEAGLLAETAAPLTSLATALLRQGRPDRAAEFGARARAALVAAP